MVHGDLTVSFCFPDIALYLFVYFPELQSVIFLSNIAALRQVYLCAVSLILYQEMLQVSQRYYNSVPFNIMKHSVQSVTSTKLANFMRKYALECFVFITAMLNSHE